MNTNKNQTGLKLDPESYVEKAAEKIKRALRQSGFNKGLYSIYERDLGVVAVGFPVLPLKNRKDFRFAYKWFVVKVTIDIDGFDPDLDWVTISASALMWASLSEKEIAELIYKVYKKVSGEDGE